MATMQEATCGAVTDAEVIQVKRPDGRHIRSGQNLEASNGEHTGADADGGAVERRRVGGGV